MVSLDTKSFGLRVNLGCASILNNVRNSKEIAMSFYRVAFKYNKGEGRIHGFSVMSRNEKCFCVEGNQEHLT